jgi:hypothetical protein
VAQPPSRAGGPAPSNCPSADPPPHPAPSTAPQTRLQIGKGYSSSREALLLNGKFVVEQLKALDARSGKSTVVYASGDFGTALQAEVRPPAAALRRCAELC